MDNGDAGIIQAAVEDKELDPTVDFMMELETLHMITIMQLAVDLITFPTSLALGVIGISV